MEELIESAKNFQQNYYERMIEWPMYKPAELETLGQHLSSAIFTREISNNDINASANAHDIVNNVVYSNDERQIINVLLEKICKYSKKTDEGGIACGIIYNVIITSDESSAENNEGNGQLTLHAVPIFKIIVPKDNKRTQYNTMGTVDNICLLTDEIWYIDVSGRIYKSWDDYMTNNTLPKCIMVVPKGGYYQTAPRLQMREASRVWIQIVQSPACNVTQKILKYADIGSTVLGVGSAALLSIASVVMPIGTFAAMAGLATTGVTAIWAASRCSQEVIDRHIHDESVKDRAAMKAWLGVSGSVLSFAVGAGTFAITRSAEKGAVVGRVWQAAYNTALIGNIAVNAIGVEHRGVCLYEKYHEGEIKTIDVLTFAGHVLLFGSAVLNCKLAKDIIESSSKNYERTVPDERHRETYNQVNANPAENTSSQITENLQIVRDIKQINTDTVDLIASNQNTSTSSPCEITARVQKISDIERVNTVPDFIPANQNSSTSSSNEVAANVQKMSDIEKVNTVPGSVAEDLNFSNDIAAKFGNDYLKISDKELVEPVLTVKNLKKTVLTWYNDNKSLTNADANNPETHSTSNSFYRTSEKLLSNLKTSSNVLLNKVSEGFSQRYAAYNMVQKVASDPETNSSSNSFYGTSEKLLSNLKTSSNVLLNKVSEGFSQTYAAYKVQRDGEGFNLISAFGESLKNICSVFSMLLSQCFLIVPCVLKNAFLIGWQIFYAIICCLISLCPLPF